MIIPPDPEKDPRLFRESTASLVTVPEDRLVDIGPTLPAATYALNPAAPVAYPYGNGPFADAFALPYDPAPPYSARRDLDPLEHASVGQGLGRSTSRISHASTSSSASSSSSRRRFDLLRRAASSSTAVDSSSEPKPFEEGLVVGRGSTRRRWHGIPIPPRPNIPLSPEMKTMWRRYRTWWIALFVLLAVGIVLAIGLASGFTTALAHEKGSDVKQKGERWPGDNGSGSINYQLSDLNMTYDPKRDGPKPGDGHMSDCNNFSLLKSTSNLTQLAVTSPSFAHYISTFTFPLNSTHNNMTALEHELYIIARGLAATGTVEVIGANGPEDVVKGGDEGQIRIDVLVRYATDRDLDDVVNVCRMTREDGSAGVGIYTPTEIDKGTPIDGLFLLDPRVTPAFHVVIRLPPSVLRSSNETVYVPSLNLDLAQMGTRIGNMQNVALFGDVEISATYRGAGVVADYLAVESCTINGAENTVQGTFNVSNQLMVNSTSGTILANVIISDPDHRDDNSTSITSTIPMPHGANSKRSMLSSRYNSGVKENLDQEDGNAESPGSALSASYVPTPPDHMVNTTFLTTEGFIFVAYLHHPPSTALQTYVSSQSGMIDVSMHPNFVGPFALQSLWGSIRLPASENPASDDPAHVGRKRVVCRGPVDLNSTYFGGFNATDESRSPTTVTGAATWVWPEMDMPRPKDIQHGVEGKGSALVASSLLGDLQVTFDGT